MPRIKEQTQDRILTTAAATATATATATVTVVYFLPTDARHWIPNGTAEVTVEIDSDTADDEWFDEIEQAAERWCESVHGKGSFFQVVWED